MWYIAVGVIAYLLGFATCCWYCKRVIKDYQKCQKLVGQIMRDIDARL